MRVAVYHDQPSGGARRALSGFGRHLAGRHRVDVFTLATADQDLLADGDWAASVTVLDYAPRPATRLGLFVNDLRRARSLDDLDRVNAQAAATIDAGGYDVVLVDACRYTYAPQLLAHVRTPAVYYCHHGPWRADDVPVRPARSVREQVRHVVHGPLESRFEARLRALDRRLVRHAGAVVVNSRYTRSRVRAWYGVEAELCPPGVDLRPVHAGHPEHILSVGALEPHKGHELVVGAVGRVAADLRRPLHIVANDGSAVYGRRLEALAARAGVDLVVRWRISDAELEAEYEKALLFAYGARHEPLGLAPLEAMAHSLAVVAVNEGGVRETVRDGVTGVLTAADVQALAGRLAVLLADPGSRARLGEAGRAEVEARWSWPERARALEQVLIQAAGREAPVAGAAAR